MEIHEENIEVFDAYLRGEMSAEEVLAFEQRLEQDKDWAEEFNAYRSFSSGMREHFRSALKQELQAMDAELDRSSIRAKRPTGNKLAWLSVGIAASLLIGLFAYGIFGKADNVALAQQYWPAEEGLPVKMSVKSPYDDAMNAFKQEQWERAAKLLQSISPQSDTAHYFLGVIYFNLQQYDDATRHLASIDQAIGLFDEVEFRLALSHLAADRKDESRAVLNRIVTSGSSFKEEATSILKEM